MAVGGKVDAGIASTSEKACADQPSTAPNVWGGGHVMEWAGRDGVRSAAKELSKVLFYPTVLYNVVRSKLQSTWHYSDAINEVSDSRVAAPRPSLTTTCRRSTSSLERSPS